MDWGDVKWSGYPRPVTKGLAKHNISPSGCRLGPKGLNDNVVNASRVDIANGAYGDAQLLVGF